MGRFITKSLSLFILLFSVHLQAQTVIRVISQPEPISPDSLRLMQPKYSPDGNYIAAGGENYRGIALLKTNGGFIRWLTRAEGAGYRFSWSDDSRKLICRIFKRDKRRRKAAVAILFAQSDSLRLITKWDKNIGVPGWCNKSRSIYFLHHNELQLVSITETKLSEEARWLRYQNLGTLQPFDLFTYISTDRLVVQDVRNSYYSHIIYPGQQLINPQLSPDQNWISYEILGQGLFIAHKSGKPIIDAGNFHNASWSPDCNWLACNREQDDGLRIVASDLYAISADGHTTIQLTQTNNLVEQQPNWSPDGQFIICSDHLQKRIYRLQIQVQ